jgi:hypothetical protein
MAEIYWSMSHQEGGCCECSAEERGLDAETGTTFNVPVAVVVLGNSSTLRQTFRLCLVHARNLLGALEISTRSPAAYQPAEEPLGASVGGILRRSGGALAKRPHPLEGWRERSVEASTHRTVVVTPRLDIASMIPVPRKAVMLIDTGSSQLTCTCEALAENLYEPGKPRWRPTPTEPHHPDCPRYSVLEDGQLPEP